MSLKASAQSPELNPQTDAKSNSESPGPISDEPLSVRAANLVTRLTCEGRNNDAEQVEQARVEFERAQDTLRGLCESFEAADSGVEQCTLDEVSPVQGPFHNH